MNPNSNSSQYLWLQWTIASLLGVAVGGAIGFVLGFGLTLIVFRSGGIIGDLILVLIALIFGLPVGGAIGMGWLQARQIRSEIRQVSLWTGATLVGVISVVALSFFSYGNSLAGLIPGGIGGGALLGSLQGLVFKRRSQYLPGWIFWNVIAVLIATQVTFLPVSLYSSSIIYHTVPIALFLYALTTGFVIQHYSRFANSDS